MDIQNNTAEVVVSYEVIYIAFAESVNLQGILQIIDETYSIEAKQQKSFHKQYDCRQTIHLDIDWNSLKAVAQKLTQIGKELKHRVAFIVSSEEQMKLILAYQTFLMHTDIRVGIFFDEKVSQEWLLS